MLKEILNDALNNLHAESGALTSSAIVSIDGLRPLQNSFSLPTAEI